VPHARPDPWVLLRCSRGCGLALSGWMLTSRGRATAPEHRARPRLAPMRPSRRWRSPARPAGPRLSHGSSCNGGPGGRSVWAEGAAHARCMALLAYRAGRASVGPHPAMGIRNPTPAASGDLRLWQWRATWQPEPDRAAGSLGAERGMSSERPWASCPRRPTLSFKAHALAWLPTWIPGTSAHANADRMDGHRQVLHPCVC
jgi:hypothetical protein